jgi:hypothetical protein
MNIAIIYTTTCIFIDNYDWLIQFRYLVQFYQVYNFILPNFRLSRPLSTGVVRVTRILYELHDKVVGSIPTVGILFLIFRHIHNLNL